MIGIQEPNDAGMKIYTEGLGGVLEPNDEGRGTIYLGYGNQMSEYWNQMMKIWETIYRELDN